jgi:hypothetical protein
VSCWAGRNELNVDTGQFQAIQDRLADLEHTVGRITAIAEPTFSILEMAFRAGHAAGRESVLGRPAGRPVPPASSPAARGRGCAVTGDRAVRWTAVLAVVAVAGVAAYVSYWHATEVVTGHGEPGMDRPPAPSG